MAARRRERRRVQLRERPGRPPAWERLDVLLVALDDLEVDQVVGAHDGADGGWGKGGGVSQEGERTLGKEDEDEDEEEHEREEQVLPGRVAYLVPDSKTPRLPVVFDVQCSMFNVQEGRLAC